MMESDPVGCNLSVLLTTLGRLIPSMDVMPENVSVDVNVTPQELCHHEAAFEEVVSELTQIFIAKMVILHCHKVRHHGTLYNFVKERSIPHGVLNLPYDNPRPTPPIPYTELLQHTYQTIPGWPSCVIGGSGLPFLELVFLVLVGLHHESETDSTKGHYIPNVSMQVPDIKGHAVQ